MRPSSATGRSGASLLQNAQTCSLVHHKAIQGWHGIALRCVGADDPVESVANVLAAEILLS
jgi:hypothetical protein